MSITKRIISLVAELLGLAVLAYLFLDFRLVLNDVLLWFAATVLLIPVSKYIDYPWFTKPNAFISIFVIISSTLFTYLLGLESDCWNYCLTKVLLVFSLLFFVISIINGIFTGKAIGNFLYEAIYKRSKAELIFFFYSIAFAFVIFGQDYGDLAVSFVIALLAYWGPIGRIFGYCFIIKQKRESIGYIHSGTGIGHVIVRVISKKYFKIGDILICNEDNKEILLQVIGAKTYEADSPKGIIDLECSVLGSLKDDKIEPYLFSFLPGSAVFFKGRIITPEYIHFAGTDIKPRFDANSLITHNSTFIGTLGSGKTRLAMQLVDLCIKNDPNLVVICFDVTNEWDNAFPDRVTKTANDNWQKDTVDSLRKARTKNIEQDGVSVTPENEFKFNESIKDFYKITENKSGFYTINVGELYVIKIGPNQKIDGQWSNPRVEMPLAEIVSKFVLAGFSKYRGNLSKQAKLLFVFEEAHSLVPEIYGYGAFDDEKKSSLHISRVIMQGRKFGIGSFTLTQRTASVSKSLLTQSNTVFAMQQFDNTGIDYFSNYFGEIANRLSSLDERQAICMGKGISHNMPIIIKAGEFKIKPNVGKPEEINESTIKT